MLKKVAIGLGVAVLAFVAFVASRPSQFHIERSAQVGAPVDVVFAQVNSYKARAAWYPWNKLDPAIQLTYTGPEAGVGAHYAWKGNDDVGSGEQTILESVSNAKIVDDLHFTAPFEARNKATFTFAAEGEGTKVTWAMDGDNNFGAKLAGLFMDMDAMIGKDFESGLKGLDEVARAAHAQKLEEAKKAAEAAAAAASAAAGAAPAATDPAAPASAAPAATPPG